ncbi:MAG: hypothetical protein ACJAXM_000772 [Arenicella sp.]|jgi:hypothetical protein
MTFSGKWGLKYSYEQKLPENLNLLYFCKTYLAQSLAFQLMVRINIIRHDHLTFMRMKIVCFLPVAHTKMALAAQTFMVAIILKVMHSFTEI